MDSSDIGEILRLADKKHIGRGTFRRNAGPRQKSISVQLALGPIYKAIAPRGPGPSDSPG